MRTEPYFILDHAWGIQLSWTLSHLLILKFIPWFALGISIYLATSREGREKWRQPALIATCAVLCLLIVDSLFLAVLAVFLGTAVFLAARGRTPLLRHRILVWLGSITYPLYLLHENIGWSLLLRLRSLGISNDVAIMIAITASLAMATALTRLVEQPAMRWIRNRYRNRRVPAP